MYALGRAVKSQPLHFYWQGRRHAARYLPVGCGFLLRVPGFTFVFTLCFYAVFFYSVFIALVQALCLSYMAFAAFCAFVLA